MKKTTLSLLFLFVACAITRAANPCVEGGPYEGAWSCRWSGAVLNSGSLSLTSIVMCVGEVVQTPSAYGITFTNGMKRRVITYDCPQNLPQTQDVVVVYAPSAITFVDGSGNPMPAVFTNAGTYTYTGRASGVAVGGVCANTAVFNIGTFVVQVWGTGDSDYDGFSDCQEAKDGTDPYSSAQSAQMWLGYWKFNDTNWFGEFGQIPVTHTNLQSMPGQNAKAVGVNSNAIARLTYRDVETNGWANLNVRQGTIRFWFRPSWASTNSGGTGPQSETRLIEMGDQAVGSPTGWWALVMNNAGNQIRFVTQTNGVGRTNLFASVNWSAEQWYQIAITYSSTNSRLYVNGQAIGTNGLGVAHYPGPSVRNQGFRVGSDKDGNRQAKGRFDDLETFNYPQTAQTISNVYAWRASQLATNTPNVNSCILRPITIKHSIISTVAVNSTFTIQRGTGPGNFSWVEGNKNEHTNPKVLATQLTNSTGFAYIGVDNTADNVVSPGKWIAGVPGNKKPIHIREALDYLITNQVPITLPIWSTNRDPGANMEYLVTNFAQVRLISHANLDENDVHKSNFTFTFLYLGNQVCITRTNTAPQVSAGPGQTICFGASAALAGSVTDDGLPAPAGLTFAWSKVSGPGTVNFVNQGATNTSATFTLPGIYRLQLLASDGELTGVDTVDINVQTNTTAVGPWGQTHCPGANVVFSTTPSGTGPFTYVWLKDGSILAGQTSSSLTLNNITVASGGTYTVRVTGTCGSVTNNAMLTVYTPTTATGPANLIRNPGENATFTVTAAGAAPFSYVWRKNGVLIPGQTGSSLNLGNVTLANAGTYCVEVTGACNSVTNCATLTVRQAPIISILYPSHGDVFAGPATIRIRTEPLDFDGFVTNVQFFSNSVPIANVTNLPFYLTLTNLLPGTYTFGAIAKDNDNLSGTATPVTITVDACNSAAALASLTLSTNQAVGGTLVTGTVTLASAAMTGGQVVSLSSPNAAVILPPSVFIAAGQTSTNFVIGTTPVSITNTTTISARYHAQGISPVAFKVIPAGGSADPNAAQCGPMDVAILIDTSGSMGTSIQSIIDNLDVVIDNVERSSGGDYRLSLITFGDTISVDEPFNPANRQAFETALNGWFDLGGTEQSHEAINTAVSGFSAGVHNGVTQTGNFNPFRATATKIIVLFTDELPTGDESYQPGIDDVKARNYALAARAQNILISAVNIHPDPINAAERETIMREYADVTEGIYIESPTGEEAGQALDAILAQCGTPLGRMVFVRDDSTADYTAFATSDTQRRSVSIENSVFDLRDVSGSVVGAYVERSGELRRNTGTHFDFEWGIRSLENSNLFSFGPLQTNAHLLEAYHPYNLVWTLPIPFHGDIGLGMGSLYPLKLADRITSICGNTIELLDLPHSQWPAAKNVLTFMATLTPEIPQGRARDIVLSGTNAPLNGAWDVVFNGTIVAFSGQPNGWSVEADHTAFGGYNVGVSPTALAYSGYEVRVASVPARSGVFSVVSSNLLNSAPVMLPLTMSSKVVTGAVPNTVTITLDKPATGNGAFVTLSWDGSSGGTLPPYVIVPAGQRTAEFTFNNQAVGSSTTFNLKASYNGYRKGVLRVLSAGGAKPSAPTGLNATPEVGQIRVQWNASAGALRYNLKRGTISGGPYTTIFEGLTGTTFVDTFVTEGQNYCYVVTAVNDNGESPISNQDCDQPLAPEVVLRPLIQPPTGTYYESVQVSMSVATPGAQIWYTLDGSGPQPNAPSLLYSSPFTLTSSKTVRARGFKSGATGSPTATANYTVHVSTVLGCNVTNNASLTNGSAYSTNRGVGFYTGRYKFTGTPGQQVTITMISTNVDAYLYLVDPTGVLVGENDDFNGSNARIVHTLSKSGTYFIEATTLGPLQVGDYSISRICKDQPELNVLRSGSLMENNKLIDFGATTIGVNVTNVVMVTNSGSAPLIISNLTITPPGRFTFAPSTFSPIAPGGSVNINVGFTASSAGQAAAAFSFRSNDGDNDGIVEDPFIINLTARANIAGTPPTVSITAPANGATFTAPASITFNTSVTIGSSPIADVSFYRLTADGPTLIAADNSSPYSVIWNNVSGGKYIFQAIVTDTLGRVGVSATVTNFVNTPPTADPDETRVSLNSVNNPIVVLPNDSDPDGHPLTVTGHTPAAHGTVVRTGNTFTYTPNTGYVGKDTFTYTISDGNGGTAIGTVTIKIPPSTLPALPIAQITSPVDNDRITSPINVVGTAQSSFLDTYELQIRPAGDESARWVTFATGTASVTAGTLGTLDPTRMLNGSYEIQLVVTDLAGQEMPADLVTVVLTDKLKIGHFTVSFTDLQIPVSGLPIRITRTYDSRNMANGDFGIGWTLDVTSVRLQKNMVIGENWQGSRSGLSYCLQDAGPHVIAIVFPDGAVQRFRPVAKVVGASGQCGVSVSSIIMARVDFEPLPGSFGVLQATSLNDLVIAPQGGSYDGPVTVNEDSGDLEEIFGPVYDPSGYIYTSREGRQYEFNAEGKIVKMTDRAGNSLTFGPDGITHSSGKSVRFFRDNGRITKIYDPNGLDANGDPSGPAALVYKYERDNLIDVQRLTDRNVEAPVYTRTTLLYTNADYPHYLTTIKDPRGLVGMRSEYDQEGRLIATTDAEGKSIRIIHDATGNREIVVDRLGNTNIHVFDTRGNVVTKINALGVTENYAYDDRNNQTNIVFGQLQTNAFRYDNGYVGEAVIGGLITNKFTFNDYGQILTAIDGRGYGTTNTYDAEGNLVRKVKAHSTNIYTFTANGDQSSEVELNGLITTNRFDEFGRVTNVALIAASGQLLKSTAYTYDANGNQTSEAVWRTLPNGQKETNVTTFIYDAQDRLIHTVDPFGKTNSTVYNVMGLVEATIDKLGRVTKYEYDLLGRVYQVTYPDQTYERSFYDPEGRLTAKLDRAGGTTSYIYDRVGRLTNLVSADGATNSTAYDDLGRVKYTVDAKGVTNQFGYDSASRRIAATNAWGVSGVQSVFAYRYDASGNMTNLVDALGRGTTNFFDAERRLVEVRLADGSGAISKYDLVGRVYETVDAAGIVTRFGYDDLGRMVAITNAFGTPDQAVTRFTFDEVGNKLTQVDAENRTTRYEYDALGRRTRRQLPLGMAETVKYDALGNMTNRVDFKNKATTYQYDAMNRLRKKIPDPSLAQLTIEFNYYPTGQRSNMVDNSGTTVYNYDVMGRLRQKATPQGTLQYDYDRDGGLTNIASATSGGASLRYTYDALNRVRTVTDSRAGVTTYDYDAVGNLKAIRLPNGITNTYSYGLVYQLQSLAISNSTGRLHSYDYLVDKNNRRTNIVESDGRRISYNFDKLMRLRQEKVENSPLSLNGTVDYLYDKVGNRTNRTASSSLVGLLPNQSLVYDINDRLSADTYDNNGNTLQTTVNNPYAGIQGIDEYDFEDQLVRRTSGADSVVIVYNGDGRKVRETTTKAGQVRTVSYLIDELNPTRYAQVLEEWVSLNGGAAQLDRVYNYGLDLVSQVFPVGALAGGQRSRYYIHDGHGSVAFLADEGGQFTDAYRYDAFGQLLEAKVRNPVSGLMEPLSGANAQYQTPNVYRYAGEQFDDSLGLYYLRARLMNPLTGRMWTADTYEGAAAEPMSLHRYLYANADPVNRIDPSGHESLVGVSVGSSIAGSLSAMYNGVVTAVGDALQATIIGVAEGKSVNDIVVGFVLDQTGLSTVFLIADVVQSIFASGGYDEETAAAIGYKIWTEEVLLTFAYAVEDHEEGDFTFTFEVELEPQPQCFIGGTLLHTAHGTRPIEALRPGDMVWAWDEIAGELILKPVSRYFAHKRDELVIINVGGQTLQATVEHPFLSPQGFWISAGAIEGGDCLLGFDLQPAVVDSVERIHGDFIVYNVEVEGAHTYFVGPDGILAHNASAAPLRKLLKMGDAPLLDAHHIVARHSKRAAGPRAVLESVGIVDLDFVQNGVALPRDMTAKKTLKSKAVPHHGGGVHSQAYNDALERRLNAAYAAGRNDAERARKMRAVLKRVGDKLKVGVLPK